LRAYIDRKIDTNLEEIKTIKSDVTEKFTIHDTNFVNDYKKITDMAKKELDNFIDDKMKNPNKEDIVDYDQTDDKYYIGIGTGGPRRYPKLPEKTCVTKRDFGSYPVFPTIACANNSINKRFTYGGKQLIPFQNSCNRPNLLTAENYYKTHYDPRSIPVTDYRLRGWNYDEYSSVPHPTKSNTRILSYNTKGLPAEDTKYKNIPTGFNYAFHNTPAMGMP